jgi:cell division protein ZapE
MSGTSIVEAYERALASRGFTDDPAQRAAVGRLQQLADDLAAAGRRGTGLLGRVFGRAPAQVRGVWLWGGVGRGKSFVMDCFYGAVGPAAKTRLHFHEFMRAVHRELETLKGRADPLDELAKRVAARHKLICFDEFHVSDIADAMILERLLRGLFSQGVCFVMTSNYRPDDLYPDGLHRDRILPAIALIHQHTDCLQVDAGQDYRRMSLAQIEAYHSPLDAAAASALGAAFDALAETADESPVLLIENREITALRRAGGVVWFDFATLCAGPRSQNDYLELATRFHTVLVSDVPKMSAAMASEARRFVWLVDVLYDQKVKLIVSAQCAPEDLYTQGAMAGEFHRTVSRIAEMQSREYLEAPRRGVATHLA